MPCRDHEKSISDEMLFFVAPRASFEMLFSWTKGLPIILAAFFGVAEAAVTLFGVFEDDCAD